MASVTDTVMDVTTNLTSEVTMLKIQGGAVQAAVNAAYMGVSQGLALMVDWQVSIEMEACRLM